MANTLSQYIGQIIDRRNQELQQRLAPLIPLLEADLAESRQRAEIEKQRQLRISDYHQLAEQYWPGTGAEWDTSVQNIQTAEGVDATWKAFVENKGRVSLTKDYGSLLSSSGVPQEKIDETLGVLSNMTSEEARLAIVKDTIINYGVESARNAAQTIGTQYYADWEQSYAVDKDPQIATGFATQKAQEREDAKAALNRYRGGGGGGDGGDTPKQEVYSVTEVISKAINKVCYTTASGRWVKYNIGGETFKIPAMVGNDGRLYVVGEQGTYLISPYNCSPPSTKIKGGYVASGNDVDRYFGGVEPTGKTTKGGTGKPDKNKEYKSLPIGTTEVDG